MTVRERKYEDGTTVWTCDFTCIPFGERVPERFRLVADEVTSRSGAERWEKDKRDWIVKNGRPYNTRKGKEELERQRQAAEAAHLPTLAEWTPTYTAKCRKKNRKPLTMTDKESSLRNHLLPILGDLPLDKCASEAEILRLRDHLEEKQLGSSKYNQITGMLKSMLRLAVADGKPVVIPTIERMPPPPEVIKFYTVEELMDLVEAAKEKRRWLLGLLLMSDAGLRSGEVCGLRWSDINFRRKTLTVNRTAWRGEEGLPKNGKARTLPIKPRLFEVLSSPFSRLHDRWVAPSAHDGQADDSTWTSMTRAVCRRADLPDFGPHALRHTFATVLLTARTNLKVIMEMMGHHSLKVTEKYTHVVPGSKEAALEAVEELEREVVTAKARHLRLVSQCD